MPKCRECQHRVAKSATACPQCGARSPSERELSWRESLSGFALLVALIAGVAGGIYWWNKWTATPEPEFTDPVLQLKHRVGRIIGGDDLRSFVVRRNVTPWLVIIEFSGDDGWSNEMIRKGIEDDMKSVFYVIYNSGNPVREVISKAYLSLIDKHGQESDDHVYQMTMRRDLAAKINWDNRHVISPHKLGIVDFIHPALLKE